MTKTKRNIIIIVAAAVAAIGIVLAIVLPLTLRSPDSTYTVTFESNGGSSVGSITDVKHNSLISKPADPAKLNHTFEGWYKESALTHAWVFEKDKVTSDITLYAKWTYNETKGLNLVLNGSEYTVMGIGNVTDENIVIPEAYNGLPVTAIANSAFKDLTTVKSVFIPDSVKSIKGGVDKGAFSGCVNLTSVRLPDGLTEIEAETFLNCSKLTAIELPSSLTALGDQAFNSCVKITEINLPAKLETIGRNVFSNCVSIEKLTVDSNNPKYRSSVGGNETNCVIETTSKGDKTVNKIVVGCKESHIPENTGRDIVIGQFAFSGCRSLASILIPSGVVEIEEYAFNGCIALEQITIPASVVRIGDYAFSSCESLKGVIFRALPDSDDEHPEYGIKELGQEAFSYCNYDEYFSIHLPDSLTHIGRGLFYNGGYPITATISTDKTYNNLKAIIDRAESEEKDYYELEIRVRCFDTDSEGVMIAGLA